MAEVIDEHDSESAILEDWCNAFDSEPEGPYIDEHKRLNRGTERNKIV